MAASSRTVHALMDVVLPDGLTVGLAGILRSTVTVDWSYVKKKYKLKVTNFLYA